MNVAQQILNIILKMMYYENFKDSLTPAENDFMCSIQLAKLKDFRMSLHGSRTIFIWESAIGESVACYVGADGFYFSETLAYKLGTYRMKDQEHELLSPDKIKIVQEEIEELKMIFRRYSQDVEMYLK